MFITASCAELSSPWRGCIGLATAADPAGPWEVEEPALVALLPEGEHTAGIRADAVELVQCPLRAAFLPPPFPFALLGSIPPNPLPHVLFCYNQRPP